MRLLRTTIAVIITAIVLVGCGGIPRVPPVRGPLWNEQGRAMHMPLIFKAYAPRPVVEWRWPKYGYGCPGETCNTKTVAALSGGLNAWLYTWRPECIYGDRHVPMVWGNGSEVALAVTAGCNDGRPLLIGNEPERCDAEGYSACVAVAEFADIVHTAAVAWHGKLWCGGTWATNDGLMYLRQARAVYEMRYGTWPCAGVHAHIYHARWEIGMAEVGIVDGLVDDAIGFIMAVGKPVIISEYGFLSTRMWHNQAVVAEVFGAYEKALADVPLISRAWFSSSFDAFNASNMINGDGTLTLVGAAWRKAALR